MPLKKPISNEMLDEIISTVRPLIGQGKVADYIPALAEVSADNLGIAVLKNDGTLLYSGDAHTPFSIQSISKVLSLTLAIEVYGDELWEQVQREPSGLAFNSLIQLELEKGVPRNPFINAGAVRVCDLLHTRLASPEHRMLQLVRSITGNESITSNQYVAKSEFKLSSRNAAMAHLMKSFGRFNGDVYRVLRQYFHHCALEMSCIDLVKCFSFLANSGKSVITDQQVVTKRQSKQINALLMTCGLYDEAGDFAYRVGMPGKSGVGGGVIAVIPTEFTVAVWSPELNRYGNSIAGVSALEHLTTETGSSIF